MASTKPPLELDVEIETADGSLYRWDPTSRLASNRPQGINFGTQRGEGYGPGGVRLTRQVMRDYLDLNLLDTIRFIGKNGEVAYEGRVHDFSRTNDPLQQFAISCIGWMSTARFRKFSEIYVDCDLSKWGEPSVARKLQLASSGFVLSANASTGWAEATTGQALNFDFTSVQATTSAQEIAELWYYANGVDIGQILFDQVGDATTPWDKSLALGTDETMSAPDVSGNYSGTAESNAQSLTATAPGKKYARARTAFTGPYVGQMTNMQRYRNVKVVGRHGLPLLGSWPNVGPASSDVLAHIFNNNTPLTWAGNATTYPVKHAAFLNEYPLDAAKSLNDLHLFELVVFEDKKVQFYPNDLTKHDWQIRTDDPGVRFNPLQGDSIDGFANGVEVTYTDFTGRTHTLYPSDHPELRDESDTNPANQHGDQLWKDFTAPFPTTEEDALQMGRAYLAECNRPKSPGTITVSGGYIMDSAGHWQQGWKVKCGETIALTNHPNDAPRLITSTPSWDQDTKTLSISVDNGYQLLQAFLSRQAIGREAAGLN